MIIGVLREPSPETRVSLLPEHITILKKWNVDVCVETNAGVTAFASDDKYAEAGAKIMSRAEVLKTAQLLLSVNNFTNEDLSAMQPGAVLMGVYSALSNAGLMKELAAKGF